MGAVIEACLVKEEVHIHLLLVGAMGGNWSDDTGTLRLSKDIGLEMPNGETDSFVKQRHPE